MKYTKFILLSALAMAIGPVSGADTYAIDAKKSKISFTIQNKPPNASESQEVPGSFKEFSGNVILDQARPSQSAVEITVQTASVDTGNAKRDDHLRNQDFFKVKEYPTMHFKSTKVTKDGDNYQVHGKFTLLDKTKVITVTFVPTGDKGGKATFQIKRSDYGMKYRVPDTADEVNITLEMVGVKK